MRPTTVQQDALLGADGAVVWPRLRIRDSGGTWRDWSEITGVSDWVRSLEWGDSLDARYPDAAVEVAYREHRRNASPLVTGNLLSGYLDVGREIEIAVALTAGPPPAGADYEIMFEGVVQSWDLRDDGVARLDCRDRIGQALADLWVEEDTEYGDGVKTSDTIIDEILSDWGDGTSLSSSSDSPSFAVNAYNQQPMSVLDAARELALLTGWDLRPRWVEPAGAHELVLTQPDRADTTPIHEFSEWIKVSRAEVNIDRVRNVIRVDYPGATNDSGQREWATVWAADGYDTGSAPWRGETVTSGSSVDKYGRRWMQVSNGSSSGIDNQTEAQDLADAILADLAEPELEFGVELGLWWPVELNDLYRFTADGERSSSDLDLAVQSFRHRITGRVARTTLGLRGKPAAGRQIWLDRGARPGTSQGISTATPGAVTVATTSRAAGIFVELGYPTTGRWDLVEIHRDTVSGFTPGDSTLVQIVRGTRYIDALIDPAVTYYYKARVLDLDGNTGDASSEASATPDELPSGYIEEGARRGASVSLSVNQNASGVVYDTIKFDTIDVGEAHSAGVASGFDTANHQFEPESSRAYRIDATIRLTGDGDATSVIGRIQNVDTSTTLMQSRAVTNGSGEEATIHLTAIVELSAGDQIEIQATGGGGTPTFSVDAARSAAHFWPLLYS